MINSLFYTGYTWVLLKGETDSFQFDLNNMKRFVGLRRKNPRLSFGLGLGGWGEGGAKYSQMVSDPAKRCTFIKSVIGIYITLGISFL